MIKAIFFRWEIIITVFITGALALIIEIVGMRLLSPYFGSTMFTTSSVISVFLAALSLGYYLGGVSADRNSSFKSFYSIILLSGTAVLATVIFKYLFLPTVGTHLSITTGPLISSMILFLLPGILLGMISPYAIKLQKDRFPTIGLGQTSGEMFFWSTVGSIGGSLLAGFVLIPQLPIDTILITTGVILIALGWVSLIRLHIPFKTYWLITGLALISFLLAVTLSQAFTSRNSLYQKEGLYQLITVVEAQENSQPARVLYLDLNRSGAAYVNSDELVFEYTKYSELYKLFKPEATQALFLGGGSYTQPQKVVQSNPNLTVEVVEIEPDLYQLSQKYFKIEANSRLINRVADGRKYLVDSQSTYDLIFSDVYLSLYSVPAHMATLEFFELAKSRLNLDGVFLANIIGTLRPETPSFLLSEIKTFQQAFPNHVILAVNSPESTAIQNLIFVGINGNKVVDWQSRAITQHSDPLVRDLGKHVVSVSPTELEKHIVFTDNFAPVDHYMSSLLAREYK